VNQRLTQESSLRRKKHHQDQDGERRAYHYDEPMAMDDAPFIWTIYQGLAFDTYCAAACYVLNLLNK